MKECFFYSRYNCASMVGVRCNLFEKTVTREVCDKCPFYIQYKQAENMIKRYVFERECKHDEQKTDNNK